MGADCITATRPTERSCDSLVLQGPGRGTVYGRIVRLKGRRLAIRLRELRQAFELTGGVGLSGPTASVKLNKTTRRLLGDFALWLSDRGVLMEGYEYEVQGAVARSVDEIRQRLRELDEELPSGDPEHDSVGELREASRKFANRHNPDLSWDDFTSKLADAEWKALGELRNTFADVLLDWYDNKGLEEAQAVLIRIPIESNRPAFLPPQS
jgi:hypothetical protein